MEIGQRQESRILRLELIKRNILQFNNCSHNATTIHLFQKRHEKLSLIYLQSSTRQQSNPLPVIADSKLITKISFCTLSKIKAIILTENTLILRNTKQ